MRTTKVKITASNHVTITRQAEAENAVGTNVTVYEKNEHPHPDFTKALESLRAHIIYNWPEPLLKAVDVDDLPDEVLETIRVNGISFDPDFESQGVTIKGMVRMRKNWTAVNVPKILYSEESYDQMDDLQKCVVNILNEADAYLNGKMAQLDMFESDQDHDPEPKKKRGRPRKQPEMAVAE